MEGTVAISFRFTKDLFPLAIFDDFLAAHKVNVLRSSMGLHEQECATPHYHYHCVCSNGFPFKSPPTQAFKNKYKSFSKQFKENTNSLSVKVTKHDDTQPAPDMGHAVESLMQGEDDRILPDPDDSWKLFYSRFLNYPLKERKPVPDFCRDINIEQACLEAAAEWTAVKTYRAKLKARKLAEESKKGVLYAHLDKQNYTLTGLHGVVRDTLSFYKGNKDAPHPCYQVKSAEIYAYHKGIWSVDDIIKRYLGKDTSLSACLDSVGIEL